MAAALGLGAWRPKAALFAFTLSVPVLNGLPTLGLADGSPALVFAALWLGLIARSCVGKAASDRAKIGLPSALLFRFPLFATDILITALLLSLGLQIWRHQSASGFWIVFRSSTADSYSDPYYFLSSAFIWLQGLFCFRALWTTASIFGTRAVTNLSPIPPLEKLQASTSEGVKTKDQEPGRDHTIIPSWLRPMCLSAAVTMAVFAFIEFKFHIPEGWTNAGLQAPYEDIFSFGGVAVSVFIFTVAVQRRTTWINVAVQILYCTGLMGLVAASWSRGTWLAAVAFLIVIAWLRLPRRGTIAFLLVMIVSVVMINVNAKRPSWQKQIYLSRLLELVQVKKVQVTTVTNMGPRRVDIYHKAVAMICESPIMGHGIGSFYLTSPSYARKEDTVYGGIPNFAHNVFLQIAAEQGVLVAGLFAALIGLALWRGLRGWHTSAVHDRASTLSNQSPSTKRLTLLGTTLALGAYVQTNLTSNSLNIYPSNQFFFWFLMAAILGMTQNKADNRISRVTAQETTN